MDPQGNATSGLGLDKQEAQPGIYDALLGEVPLAAAIHHTELAYLDLVPANRDLAGATVELVDLDRREFRLKQTLGEAAATYDDILIDCRRPWSC